MHLSNGAITPTCAVIGFATAAAGTGLLWWAQRNAPAASAPSEANERNGVRAFVAMVALVFGLQTLQIPAPSGRFAVHLLGGVLAAWQLGALRGVAAIATVLAAQALLLGDGAWSAYGVHVLAMGIVPALCLRLCGRSAVQVGVAAGLSVVFAAGIVGLAAQSAQVVSLREMLRSHVALIGTEALITTSIVWALGRSWILRVPLTAAVAAVLAVLAPAGNALPDALGHVLGEHEAAGSALPSPLAALLCLGSLLLLRARATRKAGERA